MKIFLWTLLIVGGFLLGSVHFSRIIVRGVTGKNVCEASDDGNPGTVNTFKLCGTGWGLLCLFLDVFKGFLPVLLAVLLLDPHSRAMILVTAAPVLGHATGIFNKMRGGKCIAVSFGVLFGLLPVSYALIFLAVPYIIFSTLIKINPNGLRSIITYTLFALIASAVDVARHMPFIAISCVVVAAIVIFRHALKLKEEMRRYRQEDAENGK